MQAQGGVNFGVPLYVAVLGSRGSQYSPSSSVGMGPLPIPLDILHGAHRVLDTNTISFSKDPTLKLGPEFLHELRFSQKDVVVFGPYTWEKNRVGVRVTTEFIRHPVQMLPEPIGPVYKACVVEEEV